MIYAATVVAALEMYLDPAASQRVRALWTALAGDGVQSLSALLDGKHRPHVSLVAADRLDPDAVATALAGTPVAPRLELSFDHVGVFLGRVLWLGSAPSSDLLAHQANVHGLLTKADVATDPLYTPGRWVPHCTLSMRVPNALLGQAIQRCLEALPIPATLVGGAVADHARGIWRQLP